MSLEGLDSAQLSEAFESAQAEPGGWFWAKYITRDEVELLKKGSNGTEEMRASAAGEPDDSPLYGFIRFRRRNVLVKYVPEGTSRVLKARSQVHFQLVVERFTPYDSTVTISSPRELTDAGLNSSCSTHTATASISSSNSSLRQRRLTDIAESADEGDEQRGGGSGGGGGGGGAAGLAVVVTAAAVSGSVGAGAPAIPDRDPTTASSFLSKGDFPSSTTSSTEPRRNSASSAPRPSASDIYSYYPYVPKVKLGPRLHVEPPKRPHTSNERTKTFQSPPPEELRASVPRSVQLPSRKTGKSSLTVYSIPEPQPPPSPNTPTSSSLHSFSIYSSSASVKTVSDGPTPEKQRLMKALQRRQQMAEQKQQIEIDNTNNNHANNSHATANATATTTTTITSTTTTTTTDASPTETADSSQSGEQTPTGPTMPMNDDRLDGIESVGVDPLDIGKTEKEEEEERGERKEGINDNITITASEGSIDCHDKLEGPEESLNSEKSDEVETISGEGKKDESVPKGGKKDNSAGTQGTGEGDLTPQQVQSESVTEGPEDDESDKLEGTTKVRDDVDEEESDGESTVSLETPVNEPRLVNEPRPVTMQQFTQAPVIAKSIHHTAERKPSTADKSMPPPKFPKRVERTSTIIPPNETPVIETARSVSAPFLKSARVESKPVVAKKVNVGGGGSVSQRIRQFQQLAAKPAASAVPATFSIPPRTPSRSRSNSPTPGFLANRPQSAMSNKSPPRVNSISLFDPTTSPPLALAPTPISHRVSMPPPPLPRDIVLPHPQMEFIEKDNKPQLQVTTKINREIEIPLSSPNISPKTMSRISPKASSPKEKSPDLASRKSTDIPSLEQVPTLRRSSVDVSASSSRRSSSDKERPRLFSRPSKDKDLDDVPEGNVSAPAAVNMRRGSSSSSTKSQKSPSLLKRMGSSLTRKKDSPPSPPPAPPAPVEPSKKTYLHVGSINVQLPDTMLWKRRFMKIDSSGWLFLSLTDDENAQQTRRYHISSEVKKIDLPDVDEQELPHSVRLMLLEGGMLQCACQNSAEQKQVLSVVRGCLS